MPYTINKTNGTLLSTVQDGTVDTKTLNITLVGKNFSGYGTVFNENFVQMLENFAYVTPPSKPLIGQIYYNSSSKTLKLNTGIGNDPWKSIGIIENSSSRPSGYNAGNLWWNTTEGRLYAYTGSGNNWTLVGPLTSKTSLNGAIESTILRATSGFDSVIKLINNSSEVAIVSNIDNTVNLGTSSADPSYTSFPFIKAGITLPANSSYPSGVSYWAPPNGGGGNIMWGTSASALGLVSEATGQLVYADQYLQASQLASLSNNITVGNDQGLLIGAQGVLKLHITSPNVGNITNILGSSIRFNIGTSNSSSTNSDSYYNIFSINAGINNSPTIIPNSTATVYIGTQILPFGYVYANTGTFINLTGTTINGTTINDNNNRVITSLIVNVGRGLDLGNSQSQTVTGPTSTINLVNTGTLTVIGTANQINVTSGQNPVLSLPQNIDTGATVNFNRVNATSVYDSNSRVITTATIAVNAVTRLSGTDVIPSSSQGAVTLSLPQSIATTAAVTFREVTISNALRSSSAGTVVYGTWTLASGTTFQATYADLAERYIADAEYDPGTVLIIGGEKEVTITKIRADISRSGIVSTNPAYTLNEGVGNDLSFPYIALAGRVPCKVVGPIEKGQLLVTSSVPGFAESYQLGDDPNSVIARALESFDSEYGKIQVMVI